MDSSSRRRPNDATSQPNSLIVASAPIRYLLLASGMILVGIAALGVVVPGLPTTPLLILAAACFARSSQRFYERLLANRVFGPLIREWREHRSMPARAKVSAIVLIVAVGGASLLLIAQPWLKALVALILIGLVAWLARVPTSAPLPGE